MSVDAKGDRPGPGDAGQPPRTRASDAERDAVVERLSEATAEGRLTLEELADRTEVAYLARYRDQLDRIAADLPHRDTRPVGRSEGPDIFRATTSDVTYENPVLGTSGEVEATAGFGDLTLNLAHAQAPPSGELRITAKAWGGDVKLIVPEGVVVEVSGSVRTRARDRARARELPPGAPRVLVKGTAFLGEVTVVRPRGNRRTTWREWIDEALGGAADLG